MAFVFFNFHVWKSLSLNSGPFFLNFTYDEDQKEDERKDKAPCSPTLLVMSLTP